MKGNAVFGIVFLILTAISVFYYLSYLNKKTAVDFSLPEERTGTYADITIDGYDKYGKPVSSLSIVDWKDMEYIIVNARIYNTGNQPINVSFSLASPTALNAVYALRASPVLNMPPSTYTTWSTGRSCTFASDCKQPEENCITNRCMMYASQFEKLDCVTNPTRFSIEARMDFVCQTKTMWCEAPMPVPPGGVGSFYISKYRDAIVCPQTQCPRITQFSDTSSSQLLQFTTNNSYNTSAKIVVPTDLNATEAMLNLTGKPIPFKSTKKMDVILVNDVSGSMQDNCGPDFNAQPGETPCKINDMKNASKQFVDTMLIPTDNRAGLVSYSTVVRNFTALTNNMSALNAQIDSYRALGATCISCGIVKGTELANAGANPFKVILLMSDGIANTCTWGACVDSIAKQEAIDKAKQAWDQYGIQIYTVAFGSDADVALMQTIASVGNGKYYFANETEIVEVYLDIAYLLTGVLPVDTSLDIGSNGQTEWSHSGVFNTTESVDFLPELINLMDCGCAGCHMEDGCIIDLNMFSGTMGQILVDDLSIKGCVIPQLIKNSDFTYYTIRNGMTDFSGWTETNGSHPYAYFRTDHQLRVNCLNDWRWPDAWVNISQFVDFTRINNITYSYSAQNSNGYSVRFYVGGVEVHYIGFGDNNFHSGTNTFPVTKNTPSLFSIVFSSAGTTQCVDEPTDFFAIDTVIAS